MEVARLPTARRSFAGVLPGRLTSARALTLATLAGLTALAAALRFASFGNVLPNPFYDAAVRSMGQSWHNFFYGAFEPGGSVSVDKPPVDLWLQVASTKLFGFSSTSLRLPPALAGTLAAPLLYDTVRRLAGNVAGLAAAAALAVLPVAVLTARSDTMDSVLLALLVLAAWLTVLAAERRRAWPLLLAGVAMGVAFNTKLFEAFLPLPALALLYLVAGEGSVKRRLKTLLAAGLVTVAVSMSWIVAVSLSPPPHPFPIGSTNGTVTNVVFTYNGTDRLKGNTSTPGKPAAPATTGTGRLFARGRMGYGTLVGVELAAALMLGALAAIVAVVRRVPDGRRRRAAALAFGTWLIAGAVLFSDVARLHARYLEAMTAAVAAVLGIGLASLATAAPRSRIAAVAFGAGVAGATYEAIHLSAPSAATTRVAVVAAIAAVATCVVMLLPGVTWVRRPAAGTALAVLGLVALLAAPFGTARGIAKSGASDSGRPGSMPAVQLDRLSAYLTAHSAGTRYELASSSATAAGPLIVRDGRPIVVLTTLNGRPFVGAAHLASLVKSGQVRYATLPRGHCTARFAGKARCTPAVRWARAHGTDVSAAAGLRRGTLYRLSPRSSPARTHVHGNAVRSQK